MGDDGISAIDLWLNAIEPGEAFKSISNPPEPNYNEGSAWAARPENMVGASMVPEGATAIAPDYAKADVFYVHPTTYVGTANWNADISAPMADMRACEMVAELIMPGQAGVFNGCCRVFAPRYRQASLHAFFRPCESGRSALDLAYLDVVRAFQYYLENDNKGRPFILAGHSQGTSHLIRLLSEDFSLNLKPQLIAAYLIGFKVTEEKAASFAHIVRPAKAADDHGVFIAYDSFLDGVDACNQADGAEHWVPSGWRKRFGKPVFGINPVNWSATQASLKTDHKGMGIVQVNDPALLPGLFLPGPDAGVGLKAEGLKAPITPGVAAHVDESGFLKISLPEQSYVNQGIFGGNYHNQDISLFYMNLRENVETRVASFLQAEPI